MPRFTLRLIAPAAEVTADEAQSSFYWTASGASSFTPGLGPSLGRFGNVPPLNVDLVRIAVAVFAADRTVPRAAGGADWNQRIIDLEVPVSDPGRWSSVEGELSGVLAFLSGDRWALNFNDEQAPQEAVRMEAERPERVVLLSGGADSAIGALLSRSQLTEDQHHILLSHYSANHLAPTQRHLAAELERLVPGPTQRHEVVHLARVTKRADGTNYPDEFSTRSRSFLFLALGLALAAAYEVPLWIPENGFASINPPLGPERRGSLSTRTTHPAFLSGLSDVLARVGAHGVIENPFDRQTKGEMFKWAAGLLGQEQASALLSATYSCSLTGQRAFGISPATSCGVCFGCCLLRASFLASGLQDRTGYIEAGKNAELAKWLAQQSVERQIRNFVARGVRQRDLAALNLPADFKLSEAMDLCQRGIAELRSLYT
jgi:7-cyano-7-deazaguanine synthase in queuosine biosynthesis